MTTFEFLKGLSIKLGVYSLSRRIYRKVSPRVNAQKKGDLELYRQFIRPGDLVFDIGSNMGQKAEVFLDLGATTVALEPNPHCWKILESELGRKGNISIVRKAVGAELGEAVLTFSHTASTASLNPEWRALAYRNAPTESQTVSVTTLDALIDQFGVPDFCKVDVEGFELEVVRGLSVPIPVLSLGFHRSDLEPLRRCLDRLADLGTIETNLISMNASLLSREIWMSAEELMLYLGTEVAPSSGDVFVRMHS